MSAPLPARHTTPPALVAKYQRAFALSSAPTTDLNSAIALLLECVQGDPGNLIFVETFLQTLQRADSACGRWRGFWGRVAFETASRAENWHQVVLRGTRLLVIRPSEGPVLCGLGEAMERTGHPNVALRYWSAADLAHPGDPEIQRRCAQAYSRMGLFEQAALGWRRVADRLPRDQEARDMLRRLPSSQNAPAQNDPAHVVAEHDSGVADSCKGDALEQSERLAAAGDLGGACEALRIGLQASPGDLRMAELLEDRELEVAHGRVAMARQLADPNDQLVARLHADLVRREISVFGARSARYPQDHRWKWKLALSLKQAGNFAEACRTLSEIPSGSVSRGQIDLEWGECLQHQRQFDQALAHYESAASAAENQQQLDATEQLAFYRSGMLAFQLGDVTTARHYLRALADVCPNYKDIRQHLDKIDSIRHKDGFS